MPKRPNGTGSIYRRSNGSWSAQISIEGRRLSHTAKSQAEANAWLKNIAGQVEQGLRYDSTRVNFGEYIRLWLAGIENSIRPATYTHYRILVEKYLVPAFGDNLVKDISGDQIQHQYDLWTREGTGAHTIVKIHAVLSQALSRARKTGLVFQNMAELAKPPKVPHKEMQFWSESEANRFLIASRENRLYALFYVAIVTGARQMELLGLQWQDLDWLRGTLAIRRQLSRSGGFAELKTKSGNRTIQLGQGTLAVLRGHLGQQDLDRKIAGDRWQESGQIFTNTTGTPVHPKNLVDRYFKPLVQDAGVPEIRFHDLRHTAAAIMLSHGIAVFTVSKILGHSRASITSDIYGHLIPGAADEVGQLMDDLVAPIVLPIESHRP